MAWHFLTIRKAHAEIARLAEEATRLGQSQKEWHSLNIGKANVEIERLRLVIKEARAAVPGAPANTPLPPSQISKCHPPVAGRAGGETLPAPAPQLPSRDLLNQIAALFPAVDAWQSLADGDLLALVEKAAFEAHLRFPGMRSDTDLAALYNQMDASLTIHGMARTYRAMRQSRIDSIAATFGADLEPAQTQSFALPRSADVPAIIPAAAVLPNGAAAGRPVRSQLKQIAVALDVATPAGMTDAEMFTALEEACFKRHLALPGSRSEAVLSAQYRRAEAAKVIGTTGAVLHTMLQQKINHIVSPK